MKTLIKYSVSVLSVAFLGLTAEAEVLDRPAGIKIGERLTFRPSVSMSLTYDSNVNPNDRRMKEEGDCIWTISPSFSLAYNAENWSLLASAYYSYRQYTKSEFQRRYDSHNYGQDLRWNWSDSAANEKGWSIILGESFRQVTMADDMVFDDGSHYNSDSRQFQLSGAIQRRFNEKLHGDLNASYYWMDYMNNRSSRLAYYGWDRWTVGGEVGYAASKWTDFLISGAYQGYTQDNGGGIARVDDTSKGLSVQAGIGSYMTDRISYRLLGGWSRFEYGDSAGGRSSGAENGFVYTASANWKIGETWNTMLLATSYYQPSERQYATQSRVDSISWGLAKVMVRGKLRATLDLRYRREEHEYTLTDIPGQDYTLDIMTGRIGVSYTLNRFLSVFANVEYQKSMNDQASAHNGAYDYDRIRGTIGAVLSY